MTPLYIRHEHVWRELWWSLHFECMKLHLCIRVLVRACTLFLLVGNFCLCSRQCGRLCFSRILRFRNLELLVAMVARPQIFIEWLFIKLVAIWFKNYRSCNGNALFKVAKLWVCDINLGTLTGGSAGHFQEVYVKQYLLFKLLVSLTRK